VFRQYTTNSQLSLPQKCSPAAVPISRFHPKMAILGDDTDAGLLLNTVVVIGIIGVGEVPKEQEITIKQK